MIIAKLLTLEIWRPESEFSDNWPDWTRLKCDEMELSNCIEFTAWDRDPIEPIVCTVCGVSGCGPAGCAHLIRTDDQLLWMQPYYTSRAWMSEKELTSHSIVDTVLIERGQWEDIAGRFSKVPQFEAIRRITSRDLLQLWRQQLPACVKPAKGVSNSSHLALNCIASHCLDRDAAIQLALPLLEGSELPAIPMAGRFIPVDPDADHVQTFYFDGHGFPEWRAFMSEPPHQLIIAKRWRLSE